MLQTLHRILANGVLPWWMVLGGIQITITCSMKTVFQQLVEHLGMYISFCIFQPVILQHYRDYCLTVSYNSFGGCQIINVCSTKALAKVSENISVHHLM